MAEMASLLLEAATHFAVESTVEGGAVNSDQQFERAVKEYEFAIEQQKLKREDIRDLVELTVGRMDVYHLVGALLLEFSVHLYCENHLVEKGTVPHWILLMFLLSNIGAAGYLLFAVWLSMHASVAAHSVGVRLLLNCMRVTVPSPDELVKIQTSLTLFSQFGNRMKGLLGIGSPSQLGANASKTPRNPPTWSRKLSQAPSYGSDVGGGGGMRSPTASWHPEAAAQREPSIREPSKKTPDPRPGLHDAIDMTEHKAVFQREQAKWLSYDAYARTCMALGINQMLQALSYYIVGTVEEKSPAGAVASLIGVQAMTILLLRLDAADDARSGTRGEPLKLCRGIRDMGTVLCLVPLPPCIACVYVFIQLLSLNPTLPDESRQEYDGESARWSYFVTPCFLLHCLWHFYVLRQIRPNEDMLPTRLRTVLYLDVLGKAQREQVVNVARDSIARVTAAEEKLRFCIQEVQQEERATDMLCGTKRNNDSIEAARLALESNIKGLSLQLSTGVDATTARAARAALEDARQLLRLFDLWKEVPSMCGRMKALHATEEWHHEEVTKRYEEFWSMCQELDLGLGTVSAAASEADSWGINESLGEIKDLRARQSSGGSDLNEREHVFAPRISMGSSFTHVQIPDPTEAYVQSSLYVGTSDGTYSSAPPAFGRVVDTIELPELHGKWMLRAKRAKAVNAQLHRNPLHDSAGEAVACPTLNSSLQGVPQKTLPSIIVSKFTKCLICMWLLALGVHMWRCAVHFRSEIMQPKLYVEPLDVDWPEPERLFEVYSLSCNQSMLLVSGRFAVFAARRDRDGTVGPLVHVRDVDSASCFCSESSCDAVTLDGTFTQLFSAFPGGMPLPRLDAHDIGILNGWHKVAAVRAPCSPLPCHKVFLAGWDGKAEVIIASLTTSSDLGESKPGWAGGTAKTPERKWSMRRLFALNLHSGPGMHLTKLYAEGPKVYDDILDLQFGAHGLSLTLLLGGGVVDAWDLQSGMTLGRWFLPRDTAGLEAPYENSRHAGLCHDGESLLLTRLREVGGPPRLETTPLPQVLRSHELQSLFQSVSDSGHIPPTKSMSSMS